jgi:hypothetical protein
MPNDVERDGSTMAYFKVLPQHSRGIIEEISETPVPRHMYVT